MASAAATTRLVVPPPFAITKLFGITLDELLQAKVPDLHIYREMILAFLRAAANTRDIPGPVQQGEGHCSG